MIKQIQMTGVFVNDVDKAYDFYVNKLGLEVKDDQSFGEGNRWLELVPPGAQTRLAVTRPSPEHAEGAVGGFSRIVFSSKDIQQTYEQLLGRGVEFVEKPTRQFWGGMQAQFADPDGNVFLLSEDEE
jgi:catechol 2,3-dioxygenase-like lactoylglutathione lyase family enzyme